MIRIAKPTDPKKLNQLKKKINNNQYMSVAISSIAQTLTKEIYQMNEAPNGQQ